MLLLFSRINDFAINPVMRQLRAAGLDVLRINKPEDLSFNFDLHTPGAGYFTTASGKHSFDEVSGVWIRKAGYFQGFYREESNVYAARFMQRESEELLQCVAREFAGKFLLASPTSLKFSKLDMLRRAPQFRVPVPRSWVISSRTALIACHGEVADGLITKPLTDIIEPASGVSMLTRLIDDESISKTPENFFPSLVQERIVSVTELRVVYLHGNCYAAALTPRYRSPLETDFRGNPDSNLTLSAVQLDVDFARNLDDLAQDMELEFCSFDVLVDEAGHHYLIDANPFGQFGMVSRLYGTQIEDRLANYLLKKIHHEAA